MLRRIKSQRELAEFAPQLIELHSSLDGRWEPEETPEEFASSLIDQLEDGGFYFGDVDPLTGKIIYFAVIIPQSPTKCLFWLFYMNKDFRAITKNILNELKEKFKGMGYSTVYTQSTRTASSYERWLEKFGAKKLAITYKFNL